MITENLSTLQIHKLTKEQYEKALQDGNIIPNALYLTPDDENPNLDLPIAKGTGESSLIENDLNLNQAKGKYAHAEGSDTNAIGENSHTEGKSTLAIGNNSHAEGEGNKNKQLIVATGGKLKSSSTELIYNVSGKISTDEVAVGSLVELQGDPSKFAFITAIQKQQIKLSSTLGQLTAETPINIYTNCSIAKGAGSHAEGIETKALRDGSHAEGYQTRAYGNNSHAEGDHTTAFDNYSHAEGTDSNAIGIASHAEGDSSHAEGSASHAEGDLSYSKGNASHAEGESSYAYGAGSHAEGGVTSAMGTRAHAEGSSTTALGYAAHAEGYSSTGFGYSDEEDFEYDNNEIISEWETSKFSLAKGIGSHAEGMDNLALQNYSHAEGFSTIASGDSSHAEGNQTRASGGYSHAEGNGTTAKGHSSHAEGTSTEAADHGAHAEGGLVLAQAIFSHAEGMFNVSAGEGASHAEGFHTLADGVASHTEGGMTYGFGDYAHAEGMTTIALGAGSHAEGGALSTENLTATLTSVNTEEENQQYFIENVTADQIFEGQLVMDKLIDDQIPAGQACIIAIYTNGTQIIVLLNKSIGIVDKKEVSLSSFVPTIAMGDVSHAEGQETQAKGIGSHSEGYRSRAKGNHSHAEGVESKAQGHGSHSEGSQVTAYGNYTHAEGSKTVAAGDYSHTEGISSTSYSTDNIELDNDSIIQAHIENPFSLAKGIGTHIEGKDALALGNYSHVEGRKNIAIGEASHAEGYETKAEGNGSHSEGHHTAALEEAAHAEGYLTAADGKAAHAEGSIVLAFGSQSHAEGGDENLDSKIATLTLVGGSRYTIKNISPEYIRVGKLISLSSKRQDIQNCAYIKEIQSWKSPVEIVLNKSLGSLSDTQVIVFEGVVAGGTSSHAEGIRSYAGGSDAHAEGSTTMATGHHSHAEGHISTASGVASHAEGRRTIAGGKSSHSEGYNTRANGEDSHAEGYQSYSDGSRSHAEGHRTTASGHAAHSEGFYTNATGTYSHAEGRHTLAANLTSHAEGSHTSATANFAHAEGLRTVAKGSGSHAEGVAKFKNSEMNFAISGGAGAKTYTITTMDGGMIGDWNLDPLEINVTNVLDSNNFGFQLNANEYYESQNAGVHNSYALCRVSFTLSGTRNIIIKAIQHSESGYDYGIFSNIDKTLTSDTDTSGEVSQTLKSMNGTMFIPYLSVPKGTHTIDIKFRKDHSVHKDYDSLQFQVYTGDHPASRALPVGAYVRCYDTNAQIVSSTGNTITVNRTFNPDGALTNQSARLIISGAHNEGSHVEGRDAIAFNSYAHAEGSYTMASGYSSHAEGYGTMADGDYSHAEGSNTITNTSYQHVQGKYNVEDSSKVHIVGWGSSSARKNIHTIDTSGNARFAGSVYANCTGSTLSSGNKLATEAFVTDKNYKTQQTAILSPSTTDEYTSEFIDTISQNANGVITPTKKKVQVAWSNITSKPAIASGSGENAIVEGNTGTNKASGKYSHAEGDNTIAQGFFAHAEGTKTLAAGNRAHAEGGYTASSGVDAHAEGRYTLAWGEGAHAEGYFNGTLIQTTIASKNSNIYTFTDAVSNLITTDAIVVSEDAQKIANITNIDGANITLASDTFEVDEHIRIYTDGCTIAKSKGSHAEGQGTIANANYQHVQGQYNVADSSKVHIVGWGNTTNGRKNIHTIDTQGNAHFAGDIYVNGMTNSAGAKVISTAGGSFNDSITTKGINLTNGTDYGTNVPTGASNGRLFFMPDNTADRIIQTGIDNGWRYQKFESGIVKCWRSENRTIASGEWSKGKGGGINLGLVSAEASALTNDIQFNYPSSNIFTFIERPTEIVSISNNTSWRALTFMGRNHSSVTLSTTKLYNIITYNPEDSLNVTMEFFVVGRWKE